MLFAAWTIVAALVWVACSLSTIATANSSQFSSAPSDLYSTYCNAKNYATKDDVRVSQRFLEGRIDAICHGIRLRSELVQEIPLVVAERISKIDSSVSGLGNRVDGLTTSFDSHSFRLTSLEAQKSKKKKS